MLDLKSLKTTLDLWHCMWKPEERESFETALIRAMTDAHTPNIRRASFAACNVIATPRLLGAAMSVVEQGLLPPDEIAEIERATLHLYTLQSAQQRYRGNVDVVERLVLSVINGTATKAAAALLDWIDLRDLVAVARATSDGRVYFEVRRRIDERGPHQRARALKLLGSAPTDWQPAQLRAVA